MVKKRKPTSDAVEILHERYFEGKPNRLELLEEARVNLDVAGKVYDLRTRAGLTQRQLAKRVGTTASVICRLEDADYEGHSLSMLQRIAAAVGHRVDVQFLPATRPSGVESSDLEVLPAGRPTRASQDRHHHARGGRLIKLKKGTSRPEVRPAANG